MCGVGHDEAAFVLNGLYPIIVCEGDRYFAFHNDVRPVSYTHLDVYKRQ